MKTNTEKLYKYNFIAVLIIAGVMCCSNFISGNYEPAMFLGAFIVVLVLLGFVFAKYIPLTARIVLVTLGQCCATSYVLITKGTVIESFSAFLATIVITMIYFNRKIILMQGAIISSIVIYYFIANRDLIEGKYNPVVIVVCIFSLVIGISFSCLIAYFNNKYVNAAEESLKEAEQAKTLAEEANRAKTQFLATMSHEIRTPMNAILGITQMELQDMDLPQKNLEALEKIYNSGDMLLGIINDILDMSKIETGKLEIHPVEYDLPSVIHDTAQLNAVRIGSKDIKFYIEADKSLPSLIYGDALRIRQILNNLLSNAFKYTEQGYVKLKISHTESYEGSIRLRFVIEDTGQGMKPEDCNKLFSTEYLRFNMNSNRTTEGTGLGLSITKSLLELMQGSISVDSEYGKGSIFTATVVQKSLPCLPIGEEVASKLNDFAFASKRDRQQLVVEVMPYGTILVVDDVDTNLYVAQGLMSPYQLQIETTSSGFGAIDILKEKTFDIVFMDHMMPLMDGIETTKKLREQGYKGAIIALTANAIIGNDKMFKENGFDDFISKPIDVRQLNAILNKWVRGKHPTEAKKYKPQAVEAAEIQSANITPKLLEIFCEDAKKAVVTLRSPLDSEDGIALFTTTVHAMKSALANIGKVYESKRAFELEEAGRKGDIAFIDENTDGFVAMLEGLIAEYAPDEVEPDDTDVVEDVAFLKEQLAAVTEACNDYNKKAACAAIDALKAKPWKNETLRAIEEIRDMISLESDFEGALERVGGGIL